LIDSVIEPMVFRRADALIANTDAVAGVWEKSYPGCADKIATIWNGFDNEDDIGPAPLPSRHHRVLAHFGEVTSFRHPGMLLASIARLIAAGRLDPASLRIRLVGTTECPGNPEVYDALRVRGVIETAPFLPKAEADRQMSHVEYLLLIDITSGTPGLQVPSKLYNYIRIGRPVLALTNRNSPVKRILANSGIPHVCLHPDSPKDETDGRVLNFLQFPTEPVRASDWFWTNFDSTAQTSQLASIFDRVLMPKR
jgi:hypothetical protein